MSAISPVGTDADLVRHWPLKMHLLIGVQPCQRPPRLIWMTHLFPQLLIHKTAFKIIYFIRNIVIHRTENKTERYLPALMTLHKRIISWTIKYHTNNTKRRHGSVGIATGYGLDDRASIPGGGWEFFPSPLRLDRLWGPPSLLFNAYRGLFPRR
jgi:hypothetical protein